MLYSITGCHFFGIYEKLLQATGHSMFSTIAQISGANIAFQGIFQAMYGGLESLVVSVCRQFLFVFPVAWGFAQIVKTSMDMSWLMWWTFPIAESVSCIIAIFLMKRIYKKEVESLK